MLGVSPAFSVASDTAAATFLLVYTIKQGMGWIRLILYTLDGSLCVYIEVDIFRTLYCY